MSFSSPSSCSGASHQDNKPSPGSFIPPTSLYGATTCTAHSAPGGPVGKLSSNASLVTLNLIDSPAITIYIHYLD